MLPVFLAILLADPAVFEIEGRVTPAVRALVTLHGVTSPFQETSLAGPDGRFRFRAIQAGSYTAIVFVPGQGELRRTVDFGPSQADRKGRIRVDFDLSEARLAAEAAHVVSAKELEVSREARLEYTKADKRLGARDIAGAIRHLERAVELAPKFTAAWNHLGTIAYQTRRYGDAEKYFRRALETDAGAFEPTVNLGGVLLTLNRPDEAWKYNLHSVLARPTDALANSQMGMNYFALGRMDLAEKYLREARRLDPGHFSHPQLLLAEIALRRSDPAGAAGHLEDFLARHPDWTEAAALRRRIAELRARAAQ